MRTGEHVFQTLHQTSHARGYESMAPGISELDYASDRRATTTLTHSIPGNLDGCVSHTFK
jgi:hypothetical protein